MFKKYHKTFHSIFHKSVSVFSTQFSRFSPSIVNQCRPDSESPQSLKLLLCVRACNLDAIYPFYVVSDFPKEDLLNALSSIRFQAGDLKVPERGQRALVSSEDVPLISALGRVILRKDYLVSFFKKKQSKFQS